MFREAEPETVLEIFILMILGLFMVIFGVLLFAIDSGRLPYNPDSTYGLLLVILSLQAVVLGKTPFGDFRRSWLLVIIGFCAAVVGVFGSFVPGVSSDFLRVLIGVLALGGGIALSWQLWISEDKARTWLHIGGALRHLTAACGLVYAVGIILGIGTLLPGAITNIPTAVILLAFGICVFYLAGSLWQVRRQSPADWQARGTSDPASRAPTGILQSASLPLAQALMLLLGLILVMLGVLLFPVGLGLLPFSPDGQFGVMLTVMAIQITCMGQTPVGQFPRGWPLLAVGLLFAGLGIVSSIVPGVLTAVVAILLAVLNIVAGGTSLVMLYLAAKGQAGSGDAPAAPLPLEVKRLAINQGAQGCIGILFGIGMLAQGLIPIFVTAGILIVYGLLLFDLTYLLAKLARMQPATAAPAPA